MADDVSPSQAQPLQTPLPGDDVVLAQPVLTTIAGDASAPSSTSPAAPVVASRGKEIAPVTSQPEVVPSAPVEVEPQPDAHPEIDKFVEMAEQNTTALPPETVVAQQQANQPVPQTVSQPVVVLPVAEKEYQQSHRKATHFSARWLAEWCARQIRKFKEILVIYKE